MRRYLYNIEVISYRCALEDNVLEDIFWTFKDCMLYHILSVSTNWENYYGESETEEGHFIYPLALDFIVEDCIGIDELEIYLNEILKQADNYYCYNFMYEEDWLCDEVGVSIEEEEDDNERYWD